MASRFIFISRDIAETFLLILLSIRLIGFYWHRQL